MESTVRQRKRSISEEDQDEATESTPQTGDNMCLVEQKSFSAFLLSLDIHLTRRLGLCADKDAQFGSFRPIMKLLEISCHGVPWLLGNIIAIFIFKDKHTREILVNLFVALIFDLVVVAVIKLIVRRPRPAHNKMDMFATVSVDLYSFPSGHTTRAAMLAYFILRYFTVVGFARKLVAVWAVAVATSRVLLGRHHVGDVIVGLFVGYLQFKLVVYLWLPEQLCLAMLSPIL